MSLKLPLSADCALSLCGNQLSGYQRPVNVYGQSSGQSSKQRLAGWANEKADPSLRLHGSGEYRAHERDILEVSPDYVARDRLGHQEKSRDGKGHLGIPSTRPFTFMGVREQIYY